jgi:acyl-CoA thioesterase FadM
MEFVMAAYLRAMSEWCGDLVVPAEMVVVNVAGGFQREVFVGEAEFAVSLQAIGTTSLTVLIELSQGGVPAASVTMVLVQLGPDRKHARALTDPQRALLEVVSR